MYQKIAADKTPRKTLSFVQFTDMHVDLDYAVGSNKNCNDVLCCRKENGFPTDVKDQAGLYGSVSFCDTPEITVKLMADKINELAPDAVFWTGDVPPHDQWNYSQPYEERYQTWLFDFM